MARPYTNDLWALLLVLEARRRQDDALSIARRITEITDDYFRADAMALFDRGASAFTDRQFGESATAYRQYVRLRPSEPAGWQRLALAEGSAGRITEARSASAALRLFDPAGANGIDAWLQGLLR